MAIINNRSWNVKIIPVNISKFDKIGENSMNRPKFKRHQEVVYEDNGLVMKVHSCDASVTVCYYLDENGVNKYDVFETSKLKEKLKESDQSMSNKLPSANQVGDKVYFGFTKRDIYRARILAVSFTESKVHYSVEIQIDPKTTTALHFVDSSFIYNEDRLKTL